LHVPINEAIEEWYMCFCLRLTSYLRCLCLFVHSGVQRTLCCALFVFCLRLVYPVLPVSLDCPFLIPTSVFSSVYMIHVPGINKWCDAWQWCCSRNYSNDLVPGNQTILNWCETLSGKYSSHRIRQTDVIITIIQCLTSSCRRIITFND
jgi:hypothetical protein